MGLWQRLRLQASSAGGLETRLLVWYLLIGLGWALLSNPILGLFIADPALQQRIYPLRDLFFFLFTGLFLYRILHSYLNNLRKRDQYLEHVANTDELTGLGNQRWFNQQLSQWIEQQETSPFALLFLDLDRFRVVIRTLGHETGNLLLQEIAARLSDCVGERGRLARFSGDEFALLIPEVSDNRQVADAAEDILRCLKEPFPFVEHGLHLSASIGIAIWPGDGHSAMELLKNADLARSRAKELGGNRFQFFSSNMGESYLQSLVLENRLHRALEKAELGVRYQPILDLGTGGIAGAEALICWQSQDGDSVSPAHFIPLAEETGLIEPIGEWVLHQACSQNASWQQRHLPPIRVAVNVSARQFHRADFTDVVARVLQQTGLEPRWLALEVTETALMRDVEQARTTLTTLKRLGVSVVIDDFGTGHSSLSYLKQLPVDVLKIDQSFVEGVPRSSEDSALTSAIIAMAHALGLGVVAEGVERLEQKVFLHQKGCDRIQGYLYHPPLRPEQLATLLLEHKLRTMVIG
ncbi:MAG: bifunctional diguanylate cyclase/phosphodiesterase [Deltaproteobacteria bacterium]|nr:MAG: bifunctional diguanylate cyclase/phosphodiesterase [Deltaproteobacteria bacterium]